MNELKLKLPGGGLLTIRKVAGEEQDSVMVEFFEPGENPDMDLGHGAHMTANVFAGAVRRVVDAATCGRAVCRTKEVNGVSATEKLKKIVTDSGVTYTAISHKTGIPLDTLSKTFSGKRKLTADELVSVCEALDIDMNVLKEKSPIVEWHKWCEQQTLVEGGYVPGEGLVIKRIIPPLHPSQEAAPSSGS